MGYVSDVRNGAARLVALTVALLAVLTTLSAPRGWMPGRTDEGQLSLILCASFAPVPAQRTPAPVADPAAHHGLHGGAAHTPAPLASSEPEHEHEGPRAAEVCGWAAQHAGPPPTSLSPVSALLELSITVAARWTPHAPPLLPRTAPPPPAIAPPLQV